MGIASAEADGDAHARLELHQIVFKSLYGLVVEHVSQRASSIVSLQLELTCYTCSTFSNSSLLCHMAHQRIILRLELGDALTVMLRVTGVSSNNQNQHKCALWYNPACFPG